MEAEPQDLGDEEGRVLEFIASCPEGASYFTVTTELDIARTRAVSILERLHRDGKLSFDCKTKMYYPRPDKRPDPAQSEALTLELKPEEPRKCQFCGNIIEKYLWQHERFCRENPNARKPGQKAKKREELAEPTGFEALTEPGPEPVPIDDMGPPKEQSMIPECGEACIIGPATVENSTSILYPAPDPLALFAQQHRLRVNKEIRKLRRVEGRLRRRAAAATAMADKVNAARRTKERELRRFEKELREVRG